MAAANASPESSELGGAELLAAVVAAAAEFDACGDDKDALAEVKPRCQQAVFALLGWAGGAGELEPEVDSTLAGLGGAVKWGLLRGLSRAGYHQGFGKLPLTAELTRRNLAGAPAKKAVEIVGTDLQADLDGCEDVPTLEAVQAVLKALTGAGRQARGPWAAASAGGRFKKDLGGVDLSTGVKNACRASINKAGRAAQKIERGVVYEVKRYTHNQSGKANSSEGLEETMANRKAQPDDIASQLAGIKVSGVDTSAQAAKLVGEAQKVPRCALCTKPMGDQPGNVCARCK